jgi:hypothetical protein
MSEIKDLRLGIHDNHGYIDTHYSIHGKNRLIFPIQNLGRKSSRELRYEIEYNKKAIYIII